MLAAARQELDTGVRALRARLAGAQDDTGRAGLRDSVAALTKRVTRAVAAAAAVSFPGAGPASGARPGPPLPRARPGKQL